MARPGRGRGLRGDRRRHLPDGPAPGSWSRRVQEGLKVTVVLFENGGYQSIHALQRGRIGRSFGLEFRERRRTERSRATTSRSTTPPTRAAWAARPSRADASTQFRGALAAARGGAGPGGDRRAGRAAPAAARLRVLVGRRRGPGLRARPRRGSCEAEHARGRAFQRRPPAGAVRIVATAEVPADRASGIRARWARSWSTAPDGPSLAEVLIVRGTRARRTRRSREPPRLRVVARTGAGYDKLDVDAATRRGIPIVYAPGDREPAGGRGRGSLDARRREAPARARRVWCSDARWSARYDAPGLDIDGACLGIVGFGSIGRHVARLCAGLGMEVIACDPALGRH